MTARRRHLPWLPTALYLALIFYLSSQSDPLPGLTTRVWDKALHALEYGAVGGLLLLSLRSSGVGPRLALVLAVAGASLYGLSDELHQAFVPIRSCDVRDWAADTLGGALGAALAAATLRLREARASIRPVPRRP
ncbi:MAG TPA: VanZ family protein [Anaeromyxobacteraceae bacterium]